MKTTKIGSLTQLTAETGYIHKLGTDTYAKTLVMLPGETVELYEEVGGKPACTKAEYDAKVAEMVRERYSESEEFALQRKMLNAMLNPGAMTLEEDGGSTKPDAVSEYAEYNAYVEQCKLRAKDAELYRMEE